MEQFLCDLVSVTFALEPTILRFYCENATVALGHCATIGTTQLKQRKNKGLGAPYYITPLDYSWNTPSPVAYSERNPWGYLRTTQIYNSGFTSYEIIH